MKKTDSKWFLSRVRSLIKSFNLIEGGDRIAVGLSGHAASIALLYMLVHLQKCTGFDFQIKPVHVAYTNSVSQMLSEFIKSRFNLPLAIIESYPNYSHGKHDLTNQLSEICQQKQCNKLAIAHHYNDLETEFMTNLFIGGCISFLLPFETLSPELTVIRPLLLIPKQTLVSLAQRDNLAFIESNKLKEDPPEIRLALGYLHIRYPDLSDKLISSLYHLQK